jgi:isoquinoline 1-oxidoreductase alpha subunit
MSLPSAASSIYFPNLFKAMWGQSMPDYMLDVNGEKHFVEGAEEETPLLWVLRDTLGLVGTKYGCGIAACGACTVHMDGIAVRSCSFPVSATEGQQIKTIEGLMAEDGSLHPLQKAWIEEDVAQCGYCQAGQMMSAAALLAENPNPNDQEIDDALEGNICRCGTYNRIRAAVRLAANMTSESGDGV